MSSLSAVAVVAMAIGAVAMDASETSSFECHYRSLCSLTAESRLRMDSKAEKMVSEARIFGFVRIP
jgi:hypothetical protein